jgi:hypothetical protein
MKGDFTLKIALFAYRVFSMSILKHTQGMPSSCAHHIAGDSFYHNNQALRHDYFTFKANCLIYTS